MVPPYQTKGYQMANEVTTPATTTPDKGKAAPTPAPKGSATPAPATPFVCGAYVEGQRHTKASGQRYLPAMPPYATDKQAHPQLKPGGVSGFRAYAVATAALLAERNPEGFTLQGLTNALAGNVLREVGHALAETTTPKGGWAKHNMPTWGAGQGWFLPAVPAKG